MSRRSKRTREAEATARGAATRPGRPADRRRTDRDRSADQAAPRTAPTWSLGRQLGFLAVVFAVTVVIAELAGAANLGVALGVGQIAFAIAAIYLLAKR